MMSREDIEGQIDKVRGQLENVWRHLRASEYVWPKHLVGAKREIRELNEKLKSLEEQLDALEEK